MPRTDRLHVGTLWTVTNITRDPDTDDLVDPAGLRVSARNPKGEHVAATLNRLSEGRYRARVKITAPGPWKLVWESEGEYEGNGVNEETFHPLP